MPLLTSGLGRVTARQWGLKPEPGISRESLSDLSPVNTDTRVFCVRTCDDLCSQALTGHVFTDTESDNIADSRAELNV